jgi:hypothetical protein
MKPIRASVGTRHSMSERVVQNVNVSSSGSESSSKCLLCLQRKTRIQRDVKDCLKSINCHSLYLLFHWPLWDVMLFHESLCSVSYVWQEHGICHHLPISLVVVAEEQWTDGYVKNGYISRHADDIIQHTFKVNFLTLDMSFWTMSGSSMAAYLVACTEIVLWA